MDINVYYPSREPMITKAVDQEDDSKLVADKAMLSLKPIMNSGHCKIKDNVNGYPFSPALTGKRNKGRTSSTDSTPSPS